MIGPEASLLDVAFAASTSLTRAGIVAIMCGGSAATFYSERYQSVDADFVLRFNPGIRAIDSALRSIGYSRTAGGVYVHPETRYTIEFPAGPLAIGRKIVTSWNTVVRHGEDLNVLESEDVVCDRFLHYWAWGDASARSVALDVARSVARLDIAAIEIWAENEMRFDPLYDRERWVAFLDELKAVRSKHGGDGN